MTMPTNLFKIITAIEQKSNAENYYDILEWISTLMLEDADTCPTATLQRSMQIDRLIIKINYLPLIKE